LKREARNALNALAPDPNQLLPRAGCTNCRLQNQTSHVMGKSVTVGGDDENNEWLVEDVDEEFKADLNAENDSVDSEDDYPAEEHVPNKVGAKQATNPASKRKADSGADADDDEQQLAKKSKKQDKFRALKEKRREVMSSSAAQPAAVVTKAAASVSSGFADDLSLAAIADKLRVSSQSQQAAHFRQLLPGLPQRSELEAAALQLKGSIFFFFFFFSFSLDKKMPAICTTHLRSLLVSRFSFHFHVFLVRSLCSAVPSPRQALLSRLGSRAQWSERVRAHGQVHRRFDGVAGLAGRHSQRNARRGLYQIYAVLQEG
jgi:hypothetical protein